MKLKIKKLYEDAKVPTSAYDDAAGLDLYVHSRQLDDYGNLVIGSGIAIEPEEGYYADLRLCSRNKKYDIDLTNGVGTIDGDYRGEIFAAFKPVLRFKDGTIEIPSMANVYNVGDVFAQLVFHKKESINFEIVGELTLTKRGDKGYGSSAQK